jgi:hypothetical protein
MRAIIASIIWFSSATVVLCLVLAALFLGDTLSQLTILFYRGLLFIGISMMVTFAILSVIRQIWPRWRMSDVISATVFAASFMISFFVIFPVTFDRSVTVFILSQMAANPNHSYTADEMRNIFMRIYLERDQQIERRLEEQRISGNIVRTGSGYEITHQGMQFILFGQWISPIFKTDPRMIYGEPHSTAINP